MLISGYALVVVLCNADSYCYEAIPSVWDTEKECLIEGLSTYDPAATWTLEEQEGMTSVTFYCAYMDNVTEK